jgi:anti-sigma factor RsiW
MNDNACQLLDDYLDNDLSGEGLARFEAHIEHCPVCSRAVGEQQRLEKLLCEATMRAPLPVGLNGVIASKMQASRRRRSAAVAIAVVATLAIALTWWWGQATNKPQEAIIAEQETKAAPLPPPRDEHTHNPKVKVVIRGNVDVIAVPAEIDSPNVTFFWVYPGYAREASASPTERNDQ